MVDEASEGRLYNSCLPLYHVQLEIILKGNNTFPESIISRKHQS